MYLLRRLSSAGFCRVLLLILFALPCTSPRAALAQTKRPSTKPPKSSSTPPQPATSSAANEPVQNPSLGSISGTVTDQEGSVAEGAKIALTRGDNSPNLETTSGDNGQFSFPNVAPGPFKLTVSAPGFDTKIFSGEVHAGQSFLVPEISLSITSVTASVNVELTPIEVAEEQVQEQIHQRVLGFIPNFYVSYVPDAEPLVPRQKFLLAWKSTTDPITFLGTGLFAGIAQAANQYPGYGQGAQGYFKRYGAVYADVVVSTFVGGAVMPSLLKQDPRYFYQGTGSTRSRLIHALSYSVACKGDNKQTQVNYSSIIGDFVAGGATYLYTSPSDRSAAMVIENSLIRVAEDSVAGVFQEFVLARFTSRGRAKKPSAPSKP
jgi:Carboxypeptidase regulatory-like domain